MTSTTTINSDGIEQWDLTSIVSPYLDRHMIFPLLEFSDGLIASQTVSYKAKDIAEARLALLRPTHMVDYAMDVYKSIVSEDDNTDDEIANEMKEQKDRVLRDLEELRVKCAPLDELVKDEELRVRVKSDVMD